MRVLLLLPLLLAACSVVGLGASGDVDPAELADIDLVAGSSTEHVVSRGARGRLAFILDVPERIGEGDVPLVIALPYAGSPTGAGRQYHQVLAQPGLARLEAIVVVPFAFDATWNTSGAVATVASLVEAAAEVWPVDRSRVLVTGYSNGGNGSWAQAAANPSLFSAAIPMASAPPSRPPTGLPLYVIHGRDDELFPVGGAVAAARAVEAAGGRVEIEIVPFSHYQAGRYAEVLDRAAAWVQAEVWGE